MNDRAKLAPRSLFNIKLLVDKRLKELRAKGLKHSGYELTKLKEKLEVILSD